MTLNLRSESTSQHLTRRELRLQESHRLRPWGDKSLPSDARRVAEKRRLPARALLRMHLIRAGALVLAGLLVVSYSTPAMAFNLGETPGWTTTHKLMQGTQSLLIEPSAADARIARDGYRITKAQDLAPGAYAQTAPTFVNDSASAIQWPFLVGVPITTDFGSRVAPCAGCSTDHKGIDMNPGVNTPIQAVAAGVVREVSAVDASSYGVYAVIDHQIDGQKVTSVYAHIRAGSLRLSKGQAVRVGDQIGNVGNTGRSTGPHLHFEIHVNDVPVDPFAWMTKHVR